jgi:hypothetical protein
MRNTHELRRGREIRTIVLTRRPLVPVWSLCGLAHINAREARDAFQRREEEKREREKETYE